VNKKRFIIRMVVFKMYSSVVIIVIVILFGVHGLKRCKCHKYLRDHYYFYFL